MDKEDVVHTHNGIFLSHRRNTIIPPAATWRGLEMVTLSEVKSDRQRQIPYDVTSCGIQKVTSVNFSAKQKETRRHRRQTYGYHRGKGLGERDKLGVWDNLYTLLD